MMTLTHKGGMDIEELDKSQVATVPFDPLGCAAEIDDHLNRGGNMDTRSPASQCQFVA